MSGTRTRVGASFALIAALALAMLGGTAAIGQSGGGSSDADLINRLVELGSALPPNLPPDEVIIDREQTWAEFTGDFGGTAVRLEGMSDELRALFVDGDEGDTPVAAAVSDVARSMLVARDGYAHLAEWESHDLAFPLDAFDGTAPDPGVATGADEIYGDAETGFRLILDAQDRATPALEILRDSEAADDRARSYLEQQYDAARDFDGNVRPLIHQAISIQTTQVLRTVSRFETNSPGIEPRARVMEIACVAREAYLAGESTVLEIPEEIAALGQVPAVDCPALDNDTPLTPLGR